MNVKQSSLTGGLWRYSKEVTKSHTHITFHYTLRKLRYTREWPMNQIDREKDRQTGSRSNQEDTH